MRLPEVFMALLVLFAACGVASADPIDLKPFRATYIAEWKGMTAARLDARTAERLGATPTPIRR